MELLHHGPSPVTGTKSHDESAKACVSASNRRRTKARQCTLNGRREWPPTMVGSAFFRSDRRFPRVSTPIAANGAGSSLAGPPWPRLDLRVVSTMPANRDFPNGGIKNPDNCRSSHASPRASGCGRLFSRWRHRFFQTASSTYPPRYRVTDHSGTYYCSG